MKKVSKILKKKAKALKKKAKKLVKRNCKGRLHIRAHTDSIVIRNFVKSFIREVIKLK